MNGQKQLGIDDVTKIIGRLYLDLQLAIAELEKRPAPPTTVEAPEDPEA